MTDMSSEFQAVPARRSKLSDKVFEDVRKRIVDEVWIEGTRIPAEQDLCAQFGVSRPVVRAALAQLRDEGLIDSRRGSGSFVIKPKTAQRPGFRPVETIADIIRVFEFRLSIECDSVAHAARRRTPEQMEAIEAVAAELDGQESDDTFGDADMRLHMLLAEASGNPMYAATFAMMKDQILSGMRLSGVIGGTYSHRNDAVRRHHDAVISAIRAGDADAAREAMRAHLRDARFRLLGFEVQE
jgi:GntR family transcriptional regulator, transcriptional repressor for pyruvate dehydrogenase complex